MLEVAARLAETTLTQNESAILKVQVFNGGARTISNVQGYVSLRGPANTSTAPSDYGPSTPANAVSITPGFQEFGVIEPNEWSQDVKEYTIVTHNASRGDYMALLNLTFDVVGRARASQSIQLQVEED